MACDGGNEVCPLLTESIQRRLPRVGQLVVAPSPPLIRELIEGGDVVALTKAGQHRVERPDAADDLTLVHEELGQLPPIHRALAQQPENTRLDNAAPQLRSDILDTHAKHHIMHHLISFDDLICPTSHIH